MRPIFTGLALVFCVNAHANQLLNNDKLDDATSHLTANYSPVLPTKPNLYAYHKDHKPLYVNNTNTQQVHVFGRTVEVPVSRPTSTEVTIVSDGDGLNLKTIESPDKRQSIYHEWEYLKIDNEFDDKEFKMARLLSNDGHAILFIVYDTKDRQHKNPDVGLQLSGRLDGDNWHNFLCMQNCQNIDFNIDGKKYPSISMKYGGGQLLLAKQPKTLLNHLKNGDTIKIRVMSITGDALVYVFEPEQQLSLSHLQAIK